MDFKAKFPACFPDEFADEILPKDLAVFEEPVYRVCKTGKICRESFFSTYEETILGLRKKPRDWAEKLKDPITYSTSCNLELESGKNIMKCLSRYNPECILISGTCLNKYGPAQLTSEREPDRTDDHVDWWLYGDVDVSSEFKFELSRSDI